MKDLSIAMNFFYANTHGVGLVQGTWIKLGR